VIVISRFLVLLFLVYRVDSNIKHNPD